MIFIILINIILYFILFLRLTKYIKFQIFYIIKKKGYSQNVTILAILSKFFSNKTKFDIKHIKYIKYLAV
jgi:NADH:ubiquinone oxidoreductase subunit K